MEKIKVVTAHRHCDGIARIAAITDQRLGDMPADQVTTEIKLFSCISHDDLDADEMAEFVNLCVWWLRRGWKSEKFEVNTGEMEIHEEATDGN